MAFIHCFLTAIDCLTHSHSTLFRWFRRPEEKSIGWEAHERPRRSGARPGLAGFHQSWNSGGDQLGNHQDGGSGVEDAQRECVMN